MSIKKIDFNDPKIIILLLILLITLPQLAFITIMLCKLFFSVTEKK